MATQSHTDDRSRPSKFRNEVEAASRNLPDILSSIDGVGDHRPGAIGKYNTTNMRIFG